MNAGYQTVKSKFLVAVLSLLMVFGNVASPLAGAFNVYAASGYEVVESAKAIPTGSVNADWEAAGYYVYKGGLTSYAFCLDKSKNPPEGIYTSKPITDVSGLKKEELLRILYTGFFGDAKGYSTLLPYDDASGLTSRELFWIATQYAITYYTNGKNKADEFLDNYFEKDGDKYDGVPTLVEEVANKLIKDAKDTSIIIPEPYNAYIYEQRDGQPIVAASFPKIKPTTETIPGEFVVINKVDGNGNPLSGATLHVEDAKGNTIVATYFDENGNDITKANNRFVSTGGKVTGKSSKALETGTYYVVEDSAPEGYTIDKEKTPFKIGETKTNSSEETVVVTDTTGWIIEGRSYFELKNRKALPFCVNPQAVYPWEERAGKEYTYKVIDESQVNLSEFGNKISTERKSGLFKQIFLNTIGTAGTYNNVSLTKEKIEQVKKVLWATYDFMMTGDISKDHTGIIKDNIGEKILFGTQAHGKLAQNSVSYAVEYAIAELVYPGSVNWKKIPEADSESDGLKATLARALIAAAKGNTAYFASYSGYRIIFLQISDDTKQNLIVPANDVPEVKITNSREVTPTNPDVEVTVNKFGYETNEDNVTVKHLPGAKLQIQDKDGNKVYPADKDYFLSTDSSDGVKIKLQPGTYYLVEIEPPTGYIKSDERKRFTVSESSVAGIDVSGTASVSADIYKLEYTVTRDNGLNWINQYELRYATTSNGKVEVGCIQPSIQGAGNGYKYYTENEGEQLGLDKSKIAKIKRIIAAYKNENNKLRDKLKENVNPTYVSNYLTDSVIDKSIRVAVGTAIRKIVTNTEDALPGDSMNPVGSSAAVAKHGNIWNVYNYLISLANNTQDNYLIEKQIIFLSAGTGKQDVVILDLYDVESKPANVELGNNKEKVVNTTVQKKWNNADGTNTWPTGKTAKVTVNYVGSDGQILDSQDITLRNGDAVKTKDFTMKEGAEFSIEEDEAPGYISFVSGDENEGFVITNIEKEEPDVTPTKVQITAGKTLDGGNLNTDYNGKFEFKLKGGKVANGQTPNAVIETVTNKGENVTFKEITITEPGEYKFFVTETVGNEDGVVYDRTVKEVSFTVVEIKRLSYQSGALVIDTNTVEPKDSFKLSNVTSSALVPGLNLYGYAPDNGSYIDNYGTKHLYNYFDLYDNNGTEIWNAFCLDANSKFPKERPQPMTRKGRLESNSYIGNNAEAIKAIMYYGYPVDGSGEIMDYAKSLEKTAIKGEDLFTYATNVAIWEITNPSYVMRNGSSVFSNTNVGKVVDKIKNAVKSGVPESVTVEAYYYEPTSGYNKNNPSRYYQPVVVGSATTNSVVINAGTFKNKIDTVNVKVDKSWLDADGKDLAWPTNVKSVTVKVTYGSDSDTLTLDKDHTSATTKDFKKVAGADFKVEETKVAGYTTEVKKNTDGSYSVINKEVPGPEKYVNNDVTYDFDNFDQSFEYEIMAYVTNDGTKLTVRDTLVDALEFVADGGIKVYDMGEDNDHKTTVAKNGREITPSSANAKGQNLEVVIDDAKPYRGHWIKVTFNAQIKADAYDAVKKFLDAKYASADNKAEDAANEWANISDNGLVLIKKDHDGVPNKAKYTLETENNGTFEEDTNTVTVEPKLVKTTVEKKWVGTNADKWPEDVDEIKVKVTYGDKSDTLTLTADKPKAETKYFEQVSGAKFSVEEVTVDGYASNVTGSGKDGFTITNTKDDEPEIGKFVNKDVHAKIENFDKDFTYDIVAYITKDADKAVIEDTLDNALKFVSKEGEVVISDLGQDADLAVNGSVTGGNAFSASKKASTETSVKIEGQNLTVTIGKAESLRGHWVKVTFKAEIAESVYDKLAEKIAKIEAGEAGADADDPSIGWEKVEGNEPVTGGANEHAGIANDAKYRIEVGGNTSKYSDESNTVTVEPETTKVKVSKEWLLDGESAEWPQGATVEVKLQADGKDVAGKTAELSAKQTSYTFTGLKKLEGVTYSVAEGKVENAGKYKIGDVEKVSEGVYKITNKATTPDDEKPEIEKYVDKDVHQNLVEFDRSFTYDIIAYVPKDASEITITDELVASLEFADAGDGLARKATSADKAVAAVMSKAENNHEARGSVSKDGADVERYDAKISGQKLTVEIKDIKAQNLGGKWVQVTFYAKYTDAIINAAEHGDIETITNNGSVITEKATHTGTVNQAKYSIKTDNDGLLTPKYPETPSNEVTVEPETVQIPARKVWKNADGTDVAWPKDVDKVSINVLKGSEVVDTIELTASKASGTSVKLPKLIGITYRLSEVEVPGYVTVVNGNVVTNTKIPEEEKPEPEKVSTTVTKEWLNADDSTTWPEGKTVTIHVAYGTQDEQTATLSKDNTSAKFEFTKEEGASFEVSEDNIDGYTWAVLSTGGNFIVRNTEDREIKTRELGTTVSVDGKNASDAGAIIIEPDKDGTVTKTVVDYIEYKGLTEGGVYEVTGTLNEVAAGKVVKTIATVTEEKVADKADGVWDMTFDNVKLEQGKIYVVFESAVNIAEDAKDDDKASHDNPNAVSQTVVVTNVEPEYEEEKPKDVLISKQTLGGKELEGATITVKDEDGKVVDTWVSTDKPHVLKLTEGEYSMTEVVAPAGYNKVTTEIVFTVDADGNVTLKTTEVNGGGKVEANGNHVILKDAPYTEVSITKKALGGNEIEGARMTITDSEGNVVEQWTSTKESHVVKLPDGEYVMRELVAPEGYYCVTTDMKFIVKNGEVELLTAEVNAGGRITLMEGNEIVLYDAPLVRGEYEETPDEGDVDGDNGGGVRGDYYEDDTAVVSANTGDNTAIYIWIMIFMLSISALVTANILRRRNSR